MNKKVNGNNRPSSPTSILDVPGEQRRMDVYLDDIDKINDTDCFRYRRLITLNNILKLGIKRLKVTRHCPPLRKRQYKKHLRTPSVKNLHRLRRSMQHGFKK